MRQRAARLLRRIGEQLRSGMSGPVPAGFWSELGDSESMAARVALEPGWQMAEGQPEGFTLRMQALLARIREILLATDAFGAQRRSLKLPAGTEAEVTTFQTGLAALLDGYARELSEHPLAVRAPPNVLAQRCWSDLKRQTADAQQTTYEPLLATARNLADQISGLPAWKPEQANAAFTSRASQA
ncbi:hypothetical protein [Paraburkholderia sp.]|uniref:hypothetical protein n=1 Tax=Paraburkholderia sp. TaxID=1926495 RepID=UPI00345C6350